MDALFERLGWVYGLLTVPVVFLPTIRTRVLGGVGLALVGLAASAEGAATGAATPGFLAVNAALALVGTLVIAAALSLGWRRRSARSSRSDPDAAVSKAFSFSLDALGLTGLLVALLAPQLLWFGLGAALCLAAATRATIRARRPLALLPLIIATVALGAAFALLLAVLGPLSTRVEQLAEGPVSPAAERLLVLLVGGSALLLAGLPPLDRLPWGVGLAPLAAILLGRLVVPVFPEGLAQFQAPLVLLLAVSLCWAVATGRWTRASVAGGLLGLASGERAGLVAGLVLVLWGWLVETGVALGAQRGSRLSPRWSGALALPALAAALPALTASLRVQALLSTLAVGGCIAGLLRVGLGRTAPSPGPLY